MPERWLRGNGHVTVWIPAALSLAVVLMTACQAAPIPTTTSDTLDTVPAENAMEAIPDVSLIPPLQLTPTPIDEDTVPVEVPATLKPALVSLTPTPPPAAISTLIPRITGRQLTFENQQTIPGLDLYDLAERFGKIAPGWSFTVLSRQSVGDTATLWALDLTQGVTFQVDATLRYSTLHADLYTENGTNLPDGALVEAGRVFEEEIYPSILSTFGSPPGDGEFGPIAMLHLALPAVAGYYDSTDEYPPEIYPFSNQRRLIYLNTGFANPASPLYVGLVAHEFQHVVHRATDPDEEGWVNEGLSVLANLLFDDGEVFISAYAARHAVQLNAWTAGIGTAADYGSAGLLMYYMWLHYPDDDGGLGRLVARQEDGFLGIDAYLGEQGYDLSWRDLLAEWGSANYLDTKSTWDSYPERQVRLSPSRSIRETSSFEEGQAPQFAPYYVALNLASDESYLLHFRGQFVGRLIPEADREPASSWWSGGEDAADATLTRSFDLRDVQDAELTLRIWHEIEEIWDFAYVVVSLDGGETWKPVTSPSMVPESENPIGQAFGPGYTGNSGGGSRGQWIDETVDLSAYRGLEILVRIEYVTDGAVNLTGFALGGAFLPAIGYSWDPSAGPGDWEADGFFFSDGTVGQEFEVRLLLVRPDGTHEIIPLDLDERQVGSVTFRGLGREYAEAALMIMPMAPATRQPAGFGVAVERLPR
jgi:hypothetical protein